MLTKKTFEEPLFSPGIKKKKKGNQPACMPNMAQSWHRQELRDSLSGQVLCTERKNS